MNLYERMIRTQKTVDAFKGMVFADGKADCVQLIKLHAKHMGRSLKVPRYGDMKGAADAMKSAGFKTLAEAMDAHFTRIDASRVLVSDIVEMPGGNGFSSLSVVVGNGRVVGFHESIPHCDILQPVMISGAWRIEKAKSKSQQSRGSSPNSGGPRSSTRRRRRKS